jgi:YD repeat-containing protein
VTRVSLSGIGTWQYGEDTKGREAEVQNPFGQLTTRRFDPDGKLLQEFRANGTVSEYAYTSRDWLAGIQHRLASGTVLDTFTYHYTDSQGNYDPTGHLRREVDAGGRVHSFFYNPLYELTAESHPDFGTISYTLDPNGNRTQKSQGGVTEWAGYDVHNKLLWTNQAGNFPPASGQAAAYRLYQYDPNGQPVQIEKRHPGGGVLLDQLEWDGMRKLRRMLCQGQERYTAEYDGSGTRVRSRLYGVDHLYSYGAGLLHDEAGSTVYTPGISQRKDGADAYGGCSNEPRGAPHEKRERSREVRASPAPFAGSSTVLESTPPGAKEHLQPRSLQDCCISEPSGTTRWLDGGSGRILIWVMLATR